MILGTAGHIDHGKTTLVRALTGIDTDRLQEERARGITIELGFAYLDLPDGERLGVVDVPGHERFVRHMVAGAGGIDVVMMIVAADEGVMPQTREHLEICELMGVETGFVVLTKTDLVTDEEWLMLVEDDVQTQFLGSFLEDAPMVRFAAGDGVDAERAVAFRSGVLDAIADATARAHEARGGSRAARRLSVPRLPVDRVFSVKGFGTVVTGTLLGGELATDEEVELVPGTPPGASPPRTRVRGLQIHGEDVASAPPGSRVAVNLAGLRRHEVARGQVLAPPGRVTESECFDCEVTVLAHVDGGIEDRAAVLVHTLTQQITGRAVVLDAAGGLEPGSTGWLQIRTDAPVALVSGDRLVLRGFQNVRDHGRTIGGGRVLDATAPRFRRRARARHFERLAGLAADRAEPAILARLAQRGLQGATVDQLVTTVPFDASEILDALAGLRQQRDVVRIRGLGDVLFAAVALASARKAMVARLERHHADAPESPGLDKETLRQQLDPAHPPEPRHFDAFLEAAIEDGVVVRTDAWVRVAGFLAPRDDELDAAILAAFDDLGLAGVPPQRDRLDVAIDRSDRAFDAALRRLVDGGALVRVKPDYWVRSDALDALRRTLQTHFDRSDALSLGELREHTGLSRKHMIPLVEYLDKRAWTRRDGDVRRRGPSL